MARPRRLFFAAWAALLIVAGYPLRTAAIETEWVMYRDPILSRAPIETRFPPNLVDCWLEALAMPGREMKRGAAAAIARAHRRGLAGLDAAVAPLMEVLGNPQEDRIVRLTAARALVALDARRAARLLFQSAGPADLEMAEVAEPALARWAYAPMRERWLERLEGAVGLSRLHVLAIRGLAALDAKESTPRLLQLAEDRSAPVSVRLEAAGGLGKLQDSGLAAAARKLAGDKSARAVADRLVAARMLAGHRQPEAERLLVELAVDRQPAVRAIALETLLAIDPSLIFPILQDTLACGDANVRLLGAEAIAARPSPETLARLGPMLDDRHPDVRRYACESLLALADDASLRATVLAEGRRMLHADGWRGQEQAAVLLVALGDKTITDRLLALLDAPRPEAHVAAAWGLCQLAVPSTAAPISSILERKTERCLAGEPVQERVDEQLALLAQAIGRMRYAPADVVLRKYIPKGSRLGETSRAAALWSLGHLHVGQPDEGLAVALGQRLLDLSAEEPEAEQVGRMAAVSLGRMKAAEMLPTLRSVYKSLTLDCGAGHACAWAIWQLTGEEIPPLAPRIVVENGWFLVPITESADEAAGGAGQAGKPPE